MKRYFSAIAALPLLFLYSCSGKPSEKQISKKILLEYICAENAKVNDLKITSTEETKNLMGEPAYRYTVSGEVEWPAGCKDFGSNLQPGAKESFQKTVTLSKNGNGDWQ